LKVVRGGVLCGLALIFDFFPEEEEAIVVSFGVVGRIVGDLVTLRERLEDRASGAGVRNIGIHDSSFRQANFVQCECGALSTGVAA
jgi:hypothetical protein